MFRVNEIFNCARVSKLNPKLCVCECVRGVCGCVLEWGSVLYVVPDPCPIQSACFPHIYHAYCISQLATIADCLCFPLPQNIHDKCIGQSSFPSCNALTFFQIPLREQLRNGILQRDLLDKLARFSKLSLQRLIY